jgi:hypothetical protein
MHAPKPKIRFRLGKKRNYDIEGIGCSMRRRNGSAAGLVPCDVGL